MPCGRCIPTRRSTPTGDYFRDAYRRNAGLRIDHLLLNPPAAARLVSSGVDRDVRGWQKPSDHAPTWVELRDTGTG